MSTQVYIASAVRTPIGSFNGSLASVPAHELGSCVISEALKRAHITGDRVSEVILGHVYTAGLGQNPARQASVQANIPYTVPAWSLNMLCGSGLKSVAIGYHQILSGDSKIVVAGGQESMSQVPHTIMLRNGIRLGNGTLVDALINDGLTDAFCNCHMGITCENIVKDYKITREEQDVYAFNCQMKTKRAMESGYFKDEIIPVSVSDKKGTKEVSTDEFPRPDTTLEGLSKLKPCFAKGPDATVTAGNASGMNDGAAAVVLVDGELAQAENLPILARIVSVGQGGLSPHIMGMGPVPAIRQAVKKAGWTLDDVDLFEINEPFAGVSVAILRDLGIDPEKVNVNGGAVALGHPLGASGTRVLVTLVYALKRLNKKRGVTSLCIGGGMGIAVCVERS